MNFIGEQDYLKDRLEDQINWYSKKSSFYKRCFQSARTIEIIFASVMTVLATTSLIKDSFLIPFFSLSILIIASLLALYRFQELWISYRTTSESLKHEKYLFKTKTYPYNKDDKFNLLVKNVETIISRENTLWKQKRNSEER